MLTKIRAISAVLAVAVLATAAIAGGSKTAAPARTVPGEDDYRSATGYTVAVMEHCKAINKLARGKGAFNADLAREHAAEVSRNAASAARHQKGYLSALDSASRGQVADAVATQGTSETTIQRLSATLADSLKSPSPDRKAVADAVTDLYLAARDFMTAHKSAGKTLGIRAATPPRKATPRKPKAPKNGELIGDEEGRGRQ